MIGLTVAEILSEKSSRLCLRRVDDDPSYCERCGDECGEGAAHQETPSWSCGAGIDLRDLCLVARELSGPCSGWLDKQRWTTRRQLTTDAVAVCGRRWVSRVVGRWPCGSTTRWRRCPRPRRAGGCRRFSSFVSVLPEIDLGN